MDRDENYFDNNPWPKTFGYTGHYSNGAGGKSGSKSKFKVGDIVKLKSGTSAIEVTHTKQTEIYSGPQWYLKGEYVSGVKDVAWRNQDDFEYHYDDLDDPVLSITASKKQLWYNDKTSNKPTNQETKPMLYQFNVDGNTVFGSYLATNSDGKWVMEARDTKAIHLCDKADVEEVLPYTISVVFNNNGTQEYAYLAAKGKFDVGFYLVTGLSVGWQIAQVTAVDTKSKKATKDFTPIGKLNVDMY